MIVPGYLPSLNLWITYDGAVTDEVRWYRRNVEMPRLHTTYRAKTRRRNRRRK